MEYLAFRASHSGEKVKPGQLKSKTEPTTVAMAEPAPVAVPVAPAVKPEPQPAPVVKPVEQPSKPVTVSKPVEAPQPAPVVKVVEEPKPVIVAKPAPKPVEVAVAKPVELPKPVVEVPAPKPVPAPVAKPVVTPLPQPVAQTPTRQAAVASPVMTVDAAKASNVSAGSAQQLVSNTSLSASDGFLSRRHQVTSSERTFESVHRVEPAPTQSVLPLPSMEQLVKDGKVYDANIVLAQVNSANLAMVAQAIRIIIKEKPRTGTATLYDVVRDAKAAAPRAMAIDALFQAYPQNATYSAQKLLTQTRYNRIDRLVVGNRIMQYRINRTYAAAITNLGYDASGKALFDARRGILAADKAVALDLKNYAAVSSTKHSSLVARRLYHWIRNDDTIEQAYEDTFVQHPSELGVIMFRERFGEEALASLQKAQNEVDNKLAPVVARELARISNDAASPTLMFGYHKLYLIHFATPQGDFDLLTDQTIWPDQAADELYEQSDATSSFAQKVISVKADELANIKKLPNTWKSGVAVHGTKLDTIDLK